MKAKDIIKAEMRTQIAEAMKSDNEEALVNVLSDFACNLQDDIMADAAAYRKTYDDQILARRGVRVLTSEEKKFYDQVIDAMRANDFRSAITNITDALPETVIESVMENIRTEFPLIDAVDFVNAKAMTKVIRNTQSAQKAAWGTLNSQISQSLSGSITVLSVTALKIAAYMVISQDMLLEGPQWVDAYVRRILAESWGLGMCDGIINGNGLSQPIGMIKDLSAAVDQTTGYADKSATAITKLDITQFGTIAAAIAVDATGRPRPVSEMLIVVNPVDYFKKILPASTYLTNVGTYVNNVFPFPTRIVQDANVASNKAIFGLGKQYLLAAGIGADGGRIEYSDDAQFVEDNRVYKVKGYANGRPLDNNAFWYANITNLAALQ